MQRTSTHGIWTLTTCDVEEGHRVRAVLHRQAFGIAWSFERDDRQVTALHDNPFTAAPEHIMRRITQAIQ